jgi:hypothetical protein
LAEDREIVKKWRKDRWLRVGVTAAVVLLVGILLVTGRVWTIISEYSFKIKSTYWPSKEVLFEEIWSLEFREEFDTGKRVGGFGSWALSMGNFRNEEFGNYTLYGNNCCKAYVVVETADGMVVVNEKDREKTLKLYEKIKERWENTH